MESFESNKLPIKYLITKGNLSQENYSQQLADTLQTIKSAIASNISLIQIREKKLPAKLLFELVSKAVRIAKDSETKILVNDRIDIALASQADGLHLTSNSIPISDIRKNSPPNLIVGVSTHTISKAENAKLQGADFATFSPIFSTISKATYGNPKGLDQLRKVCEKLNPFPIIALGGISEKNYQKTLANGAIGFAGISFFQTRIK